MCKAFVIVENEECVQSFCLWRMKSVCKVFDCMKSVQSVIVENE